MGIWRSWRGQGGRGGEGGGKEGGFKCPNVCLFIQLAVVLATAHAAKSLPLATKSTMNLTRLFQFSSQKQRYIKTVALIYKFPNPAGLTNIPPTLLSPLNSECMKTIK